MSLSKPTITTVMIRPERYTEGNQHSLWFRLAACIGKVNKEPVVWRDAEIDREDRFPPLTLMLRHIVAGIDCPIILKFAERESWDFTLDGKKMHVPESREFQWIFDLAEPVTPDEIHPSFVDSLREMREHTPSSE